MPLNCSLCCKSTVSKPHRLTISDFHQLLPNYILSQKYWSIEYLHKWYVSPDKAFLPQSSDLLPIHNALNVLFFESILIAHFQKQKRRPNEVMIIVSLIHFHLCPRLTCPEWSPPSKTIWRSAFWRSLSLPPTNYRYKEVWPKKLNSEDVFSGRRPDPVTVFHT